MPTKSAVIFGDEVTEGMTLLIECDGQSCRYPGEHGPLADHEATVARLRASGDSVMIYGVLNDVDGGQHGWHSLEREPVRIVVGDRVAVCG